MCLARFYKSVIEIFVVISCVFRFDVKNRSRSSQLSQVFAVVIVVVFLV